LVEAEVESSSWKETVMVMEKQKSLDKTPKMETKTGPQSCLAMDLVTGLVTDLAMGLEMGSEMGSEMGWEMVTGSETGSETDLVMGMAKDLEKEMEMEKAKEKAKGLELVHPSTGCNQSRFPKLQDRIPSEKHRREAGRSHSERHRIECFER
jgi:hypothetical protein